MTFEQSRVNFQWMIFQSWLNHAMKSSPSALRETPSLKTVMDVIDGVHYMHVINLSID